MELIEGVPVERTMKRDGRTFDHQALEAIRLMAVERVREGETASKVIGAFGLDTARRFTSGFKRRCSQAWESRRCARQRRRDGRAA